MKRVRSHFSLIALALVVVFGLSLETAAQTQTTVFINEIHYDNDGTDTGESIEVAGPAGTELSGWSLVLYNGNGGSTYGTTALTGTIPDQQGGFGTIVVSYPLNGIQNGSPDGIALVDNSNSVVQFLSYEGSFTAVGGPADGMTSSDIGVEEPGSTPIGHSLQLGGSGTTYEEFSWQEPAPNTFSAVNSAQTFGDGTTPLHLVINEIDYDQPSTDSAEFVEIKNVGGSDANLDAVTLELVNGTGGGATIYQTVDLPDVTLTADDYFVVCANTATVANCDFDILPDTNLIQNGAPDAVGLRFNGDLIDAVSYEGDSGAPYTEGSGAGLEDNHDAGIKSISRCDDGADTDQNNVDFAFVDSTPGEANACDGGPVAAELVINEIDYDQPSTDAAEFVEIRNNSDSGVDLSSYSLEFVNGSNNTVYVTEQLPSVVLASGDYFVVCGDAANVTNCDLDISPNTNLIQNGDPDAVALLFNGEIVDTVSYEGDVPGYTEGSGAGLADSDAEGESISRCDDGVDTDQNNVDFVLTDSTPGEANACDDNGGGGDELCGDPFTAIYNIQGSGDASPLDGQTVSTEGIVVGDFQDNDGDVFDTDLGGFHIQDPTGDGDSATSDGIFVFAEGSPNVAVGDAVRVTGVVDEFFNLTELTDVSSVQVCSSGNSVTPTEVTLPVTSLGDFEKYEGMLVTFPQTLSISEYFNYDRFGEIVLTTERQFQPTAVYEPGSPEAEALAQANSLSRITLDDGRSVQNPDPAYHPNGGIFDLTNLFRGGDTVQNVTGVLDFSFGLYRIQPTTGADYTAANPRPETHDAVGGSLEVASFNVLNYFTTIDQGQDNCGPSGNLECRGADTEEELQRQRAKILAALEAINADIVGLIEIQNDAGESVADLVAGLNEAMGAGTYAYIDTGFIGTDAIKVAMIYKPATVTPTGDYAILDSSEHALFDDTRNRPMLTQTFTENATGEVVTVSVNHLKSKGSECGPGDDDPVQGNCNLTRTLAAQAIVEWLATDPTGSGDPDHLIIGDLNAYDKEDPIDVLVNNGYTDLVLKYEGEFAYSYVFDGQLGYLDHALSSDSLTSQVTGATVWNINADEPDLIDYDMSFKQDPQDELYEPNAYRSSDHDPVIVGLDLNAPPVCEAATPSVASLWPPTHQFVSIDILGVTDPTGDGFTISIDSIFQDEAVDAPDSGNTAPDGQGVGTSTAEVRAERVGTADGRVYHITFTATDDGGASCSGTVQVGVPVGRNDTPVDNGPIYDSTATP